MWTANWKLPLKLWWNPCYSVYLRRSLPKFLLCHPRLLSTVSSSLLSFAVSSTLSVHSFFMSSELCARSQLLCGQKAWNIWRNCRAESVEDIPALSFRYISAITAASALVTFVSIKYFTVSWKILTSSLTKFCRNVKLALISIDNIANPYPIILGWVGDMVKGYRSQSAWQCQLTFRQNSAKDDVEILQETVKYLMATMFTKAEAARCNRQNTAGRECWNVLVPRSLELMLIYNAEVNFILMTGWI